MTMKNEHKLVMKATLTDDEQLYVDARNDLRQLREEYLAHRSGDSEDPAIDDGEGLDDADEDDEDELSPAEWVASASKAEIMAELKRRKVEFDPKSNKDVLGAQLIAAV